MNVLFCFIFVSQIKFTEVSNSRIKFARYTDRWRNKICLILLLTKFASTTYHHLSFLYDQNQTNQMK